MKLSRRTALALAAVAMAPSIVEAAPSTEGGEASIFASFDVEPLDWSRRPDSDELSPIVVKWHETMVGIRQHAADWIEHRVASKVKGLNRNLELGPQVEISLYTTDDKRWLDGVRGFKADVLKVDRKAAFDPHRNDIIRLAARKRALDYKQHHKDSFSGRLAGRGIHSNNWKLWEAFFFERRAKDVRSIGINVPLLSVYSKV